ncbi:MAG TPA: hypothetical protein VG051_07580 [Candidatus Acidoferrum sp.]|nr:hypothetical protein [Candidatus Acidoferrum sp.]
MAPRSPIRSFFLLLLASAGFWAVGCTASLGPGYAIEKQEVRVHFLPGPEPKILLDADYHLRNSGNQPLSSLELRLPGRRRFHIGAAHAEWDGAVLAFGSSPDNPRNTLLKFPGAWPVATRHTLHLSAEILQPDPGEPGLSFASDAFFLPAQGWSPELLPAEGLFPTGGVPPARWDLIVQVPDNFVVHTSGKEGKTSRGRGELVLRATQTPQDRYPFVIAGRYVSTSLDTSKQKVYLWTRTAEQASGLKAASDSLVRAISAYDSVFGSRGNDAHPFWIVECPVAAGCFSASVSAYAKFFGEAEEPTSAEMASFDSVLAHISGGTPKIGAAVAPSLAASWLGYGQNPGFYEQEAPLNALPAYAAALGRESIEGPSFREETIRRALRLIPWNAPKQKTEDLVLLRAKSFLFFYALRERYGQEAFHSALAHMLGARRGRGFNLADLVSAFEQETHQNVAQFVRLWMKHPGVPDEFRARHEDAAAAATGSSKEDVP